MAKCPHCNYKLRLIDFKAECPVCKVNIPNYNWEERLDQDAINSERSFASFRRKTGAFKNAFLGSKLRIARLVMTFAPLLFFLFPMFSFNAKLPFSTGFENVSALGLILDIVNGKLDILSLLNLTGLEKSGTAFTMLFLALVMVVLGIVAGVLNFFVLILSCFGYHAKGNIALCAISNLTFIAAIVMIIVSSSMFAASIPEMFELKLSYSLFVGILFFTINLTINIITEKQFRPLRKELAELELQDINKAIEELKKI